MIAREPHLSPMPATSYRQVCVPTTASKHPVILVPTRLPVRLLSLLACQTDSTFIRHFTSRPLNFNRSLSPPLRAVPSVDRVN